MDQLDQKSLKKLQSALLQTLKAIDRFCKDNDIEYFLDGGTALGARRHQGFIPWDDDIDLGMLRPDYDRFIELARTGLPDGYSLHTYDDTEGFASLFAKVYMDGTRFETAETIESGCPQCIFVDIFPYDVMSSDPKEAQAQLRAGGLWQRISYLREAKTIQVPGTGIKKAILGAGCKVAHFAVRAFVSRNAIERNFAKAQQFTAEPSMDWNLLSYPIPSISQDILVPTKPLPFEDAEFPCPAKIEQHLTLMYGENWTELPPVEKRHTHAPLILDFGDRL